MAHIREPRVRETSITTGTGNIVLSGAMHGSLAFSDVMATGDTCDVVVSYGDAFQEFVATMQANGSLARTSTSRSLHANGTIDTSNVSFAAGVKTVIMTIRASRAAALDGSVRFDIAQSLSAPQQAQARANASPFAAGTVMLFQQTAAPTGWTKQTTHNDKALRVVSGTVTSGGSSPFSTVFGKTATDATTLTSAQVPATAVTVAVTNPAHLHAGGQANVQQGREDRGDGNLGGLSSFSGGNIWGDTAVNTSNATTAITATGTVNGSAGSHTHPIDIRVQYVDIIIATKDA